MADKRGSDSKKWSGGFTEAEMQAAAFRRRMKEEAAAPVVKKEEKKKKKKKSKKHHKGDKDEFGRDIMPGMTSRSPSQSSRSSSPPPDPIRPDVSCHS
ncbi:unnamed protein product [Aphanomyces euteiches]|nr:hypothetical protein Ae201684P_008189 [Aphanomyces euteiches]